MSTFEPDKPGPDQSAPGQESTLSSPSGVSNVSDASDASVNPPSLSTDHAEPAAEPAAEPVSVVSPVAARPGPAPKIRRPGWGFMARHPAHWIALGFGSGLPWVVPGTFGTLFGWVCFLAMAPYLTDGGWALTIISGFLIGIWACGVTGRHLGVSDHGSIVWDEIVAIWLVLWFVPKTVGDQAVAFLIFRIIDIVKPQPIRYFDARWKNGFGVMFDDLLAAFFTLLLFAVYYRFAGLPAGGLS